MAHPRLAGEEPGVARGDLHVEPRLGDEDPDLVEGPDDGEGDEGADERDQAHRRQPGGHAEHVLLGDSHLEVAVRVGLLEDVGPRRAADVAVEHDDPRVVVRQLRDGLAEDLPHGPSHRQRHRGSPSAGRERLAQVGHRRLELLRLDGAGMPVVVALHVGDALALDRVGDDRDRPAVAAAGLVEHAQDVGDVVAVDLEHPPAEGGPLGDELAGSLGRRPAVRSVAGPAVLLELVVVDDRDEVVEAVAGRRHGRLPDLALLALAVAEHDVGPAGASRQARAEGHAHPGRDAHAERAGRHVEAGQAGHVRVALEARVRRVEGRAAPPPGSSRGGPSRRRGRSTNGPWRG